MLTTIKQIMKSSRRITKIGLLLLTTLLFTGCNTIPSRSTGNIVPMNTAENEIMLESLTVGILAGAAAAALAANLATKGKNKKRNTIFGALIGGGLGYLAAKAQAKKQIATLRDYKLKNKELEKMLYSAQTYNRKIANYNHNLKQEFLKLSDACKKKKSCIAQKQKSAEQSMINIEKTIIERNAIAASLEEDQQEMLNNEIKILEKEMDTLQTTINKYNNLGGVRVGMTATENEFIFG